MPIESPFHDGELAIQNRAGEADIARRTGRVIAGSLMPRAIDLIGQLPMVALGSLDDEDRLWASLLVGRPGFMSAEALSVEIDLTRTVRLPHDPLWVNVERRPRIGALMIELATRRRLRVNGRARLIGADRLRLDVQEAYPNCPKYIQRRRVRIGAPPAEAGTPRRGRAFERHHEAMIGAADTLFVASAHPDRGTDASHRGGSPGFVRVLDPVTLRIPDYRGNSMFNTLGNFAAHAAAGLVFHDFERGRILQVTGRPEILWDLDEPDHPTGGTKRYWDLHVEGWIETALAGSPRWERLDASPHNPTTP